MTVGFLIDAWRSSSVLARACIAGVVVLLLLLTAGAGAGIWERFREKAFDRQEAAKEEEVNELGDRIEELKLKAERAEAKAEVADQKAETLEALSKEQGQQAQVAAKKVDEAFKQFQEDTSITGAEVTDEVRRKRICEKRRELGYPCE